MKLYWTIDSLALVAAIASLALVYGLSTYWPVLLALPAMLLFWVLGKGKSASWRGSALLCLYLALAVTALLLKRPLVPMVLGCIAALIWWDLQDLRVAQSGPVRARASSSLQKHRFRSLALTAGASVFLPGIGLWLRVQLPFGIIALLILLITGCLVYAVGIFRHPPLSRE